MKRCLFIVAVLILTSLSSFADSKDFCGIIQISSTQTDGNYTEMISLNFQSAEDFQNFNPQSLSDVLSSDNAETYILSLSVTTKSNGIQKAFTLEVKEVPAKDLADRINRLKVRLLTTLN